MRQVKAQLPSLISFSVKVPFTTANVTKCTCPECPVQSKSKCVSNLMANIKTAMNKNPLSREDIPSMYCSTGVASCSGLNAAKPCICGSCPVFKEYNLGSGQPGEYYCQNGQAR